MQIQFFTYETNERIETEIRFRLLRIVTGVELSIFHILERIARVFNAFRLSLNAYKSAVRLFRLKLESQV